MDKENITIQEFADVAVERINQMIDAAENFEKRIKRLEKAVEQLSALDPTITPTK